MLDFNLDSYTYTLMILLLVLVSSILNIVLNSKYKKAKKSIKTSGDTRYMELVNLFPQMVVELDSYGNFTFINQQGLDLLSYSKFEIEKKTIHSLIHSKDLDAFKEEFLYLLEGGENKAQEYRIINKKNDVLFMVFYLKRTYSAETKNVCLRGIIIDISKRIALERKVLSTVLETEDKERQRFSEDLHDGLGPLLSTVKLYINQLKSENKCNREDEEMLTYANDLLNEAITTTRYIANNILPGSINDNGLIAALQSFISHIQKAGNVNIEFVHNLDNRFEKNIELNFYRIIIELINNSIKYAKSNLIEIIINYEDKVLSLQYKDDGIGFDKSTIIKGLGLNNIKNRSKSINGEYEYSSEINKGMTFRLQVDII